LVDFLVLAALRQESVLLQILTRAGSCRPVIP